MHKWSTAGARPNSPTASTSNSTSPGSLSPAYELEGKKIEEQFQGAILGKRKLYPDGTELASFRPSPSAIAGSPRLHAIYREESMGIFFRVPSSFVPHLKVILEHDTGVQDCLLVLGYRSFAWLDLTEAAAQGTCGEGSGAGPTLDGNKRAAGSFSLLCGYNISTCPEWVGDGISFSGCGILEQQRLLTEQLSHQFHARKGGFDVVEDEVEY